MCVSHAHLADAGVGVGGVALGDKADDEAFDGTADYAHENFHGSDVDWGAVHVQDLEPEFGGVPGGETRQDKVHQHQRI